MDNTFGFDRAHLIDSHLSTGSYLTAYPVFIKKTAWKTRHGCTPERQCSYASSSSYLRGDQQNFLSNSPSLLLWKQWIPRHKAKQGVQWLKQTLLDQPKRSHDVTFSRKFRRESSLLSNHHSFLLPRWSTSFLKIAAVRKDKTVPSVNWQAFKNDFSFIGSTAKQSCRNFCKFVIRIRQMKKYEWFRLRARFFLKRL